VFIGKQPHQLLTSSLDAMSQPKAALERFLNCDPHQGGAAIQGSVKSGVVVTLNTGDTPAFGDSCVRSSPCLRGANSSCRMLCGSLDSSPWATEQHYFQIPIALPSWAGGSTVGQFCWAAAVTAKNTKSTESQKMMRFGLF